MHWWGGRRGIVLQPGDLAGGTVPAPSRFSRTGCLSSWSSATPGARSRGHRSDGQPLGRHPRRSCWRSSRSTPLRRAPLLYSWLPIAGWTMGSNRAPRVVVGAGPVELRQRPVLVLVIPDVATASWGWFAIRPTVAPAAPRADRLPARTRCPPPQPAPHRPAPPPQAPAKPAAPTRTPATQPPASSSSVRRHDGCPPDPQRRARRRHLKQR